MHNHRHVIDNIVLYTWKLLDELLEFFFFFCHKKEIKLF